jgi:hypothetical protein
MKSIAIAAGLALTVAACGQATGQPQAKAGGASADRPQAPPGGTSAGRSQTPSATAAPAVEPVGAGALAALLPELQGWQRGQPAGERVTSPISFSDASVRLTNDMAVITVKITDTALNPAFAAPFAQFLAGGYERKSATGYEKSIKAGEAPGGEKWDAATKSGNVTVLVNRRFLVEVDGSGIPDPKILHVALDHTGLGRLAALK